ncbi:outer membrane protein assembly factor BamB family protein [Spirosoma areae]
MKVKNDLLHPLILVGFLMLLTDAPVVAQASWAKLMPGVGTFSSPRVTDLNRDGVGDIVVGLGRQEFQACDSAIVALDGKTGELLWKKPAADQIFGSAILTDLNADGVQDIIIGGRRGELQAINGVTGQIIWRFDQKTKPKKVDKWYNFYNPQLIPDQNGDGLEDLLVSSGGDVTVEPYNPKRPPGMLVVLSAKDGHVLAEALVPDGKETYMSVSVLKDPTNNSCQLIFGTGGETLGGNLYVGSLASVMAGDLSSARKLATSPDKGFIAPAVWVDITGDGTRDIVANAVDGRMLAFDGKTLAPLWSMKTTNTEAYSSMAVGYFNRDSIPDFFVSFARGKWPKLEWTDQFMVNGKNGTVEFRDSLGFYQTSSPVVVDFDEDGQDEVILSVNYQAEDSLGIKTYYNTLSVIGFGTNEVVNLFAGLPGHNIASTPWIGDLDKDNKLDIVLCSSSNKYKTYSFDGVRISCFKTALSITKPIRWGAYMGSHYDGVFR